MQRTTIRNNLGKIHFRTDFIFKIQLLFGELVFEFSNLPIGKCILHGDGNLICDLGEKLDIATEGVVLIFNHTEYPQHATSANKRKDADRSNFGLQGVLHSQPPCLLEGLLPRYLHQWDKAFLVDRFVAENRIQGVDPQMCIVGIGKSDANAIAAHNPARTRHYGSEKIPELESGNHVIGQFKEKSNTLVLLQQLLL